MKFQALKQRIEQARDCLGGESVPLVLTCKRHPNCGLTRIVGLDPEGAITDERVGVLESDGDLQPLTRHTRLLRLVVPNELRRPAQIASFPTLISRHLRIASIRKERLHIRLVEAPEHKPG